MGQGHSSSSSHGAGSSGGGRRASRLGGDGDVDRVGDGLSIDQAGGKVLEPPERAADRSPSASQPSPSTSTTSPRRSRPLSSLLRRPKSSASSASSFLSEMNSTSSQPDAAEGSPECNPKKDNKKRLSILSGGKRRRIKTGDNSDLEAVAAAPVHLNDTVNAIGVGEDGEEDAMERVRVDKGKQRERDEVGVVERLLSEDTEMTEEPEADESTSSPPPPTPPATSAAAPEVLQRFPSFANPPTPHSEDPNSILSTSTARTHFPDASVPNPLPEIPSEAIVYQGPRTPEEERDALLLERNAVRDLITSVLGNGTVGSESGATTAGGIADTDPGESALGGDVATVDGDGESGDGSLQTVDEGVSSRRIVLQGTIITSVPPFPSTQPSSSMSPPSPSGLSNTTASDRTSPVMGARPAPTTSPDSAGSLPPDGRAHGYVPELGREEILDHLRRGTAGSDAPDDATRSGGQETQTETTNDSGFHESPSLSRDSPFSPSSSSHELASSDAQAHAPLQEGPMPTPSSSSANPAATHRPSTSSPAPTANQIEQAQMISRLLSVAAAATAASLLPGSVSINGRPLTPANVGDGQDGGVGILGVRGIPVSAQTPASDESGAATAGGAATGLWGSRLRSRANRQRAGSFGSSVASGRAGGGAGLVSGSPSTPSVSLPSVPDRPIIDPPHASAPSSNLTSNRPSTAPTLSTLLREALNAAFGPTSPVSLPAPASVGTAGGRFGSLRDIDGGGRLFGPSPSRPSQTTATNPGTASTAARPPASDLGLGVGIGGVLGLGLSNNNEGPSNDATSVRPRLQAPEGSFERFLADLEVDVGAAILRRSGNSNVDTASGSGHTAPDGRALEPTLPTNPPQDPPLPDGPNPPPSTGTGSSPSDPFSFYRAYSFPARVVARLAPRTSPQQSTLPPRMAATGARPSDPSRNPPRPEHSMGVNTSLSSPPSLLSSTATDSNHDNVSDGQRSPRSYQTDNLDATLPSSLPITPLPPPSGPAMSSNDEVSSTTTHPTSSNSNEPPPADSVPSSTASGSRLTPRSDPPPPVASPAENTTAPRTAGTMDAAPPRASEPTPPQLIPMIIVGLRTVEPGQNPFSFGPIPFGPSARTQPRNGNAGEAEATRREAGEGSDSTVDGDGDTRMGGVGEGWTGPSTESRRPSADPGHPRRESPAWLLYISGGFYPTAHPILRFPGLFSGTEMTYEDWNHLAELIGQVKPPTASREEIEKSGLKIVNGSEIAELEARGDVISNTAEKCLVCLSEYDPEERIRVMACKHAFHKDCVDRWLETGRNNCPTCRHPGVGRGKDTSESSAPNATAVPGTGSSGSDAMEDPDGDVSMLDPGVGAGPASGSIGDLLD